MTEQTEAERAAETIITDALVPMLKNLQVDITQVKLLVSVLTGVPHEYAQRIVTQCIAHLLHGQIITTGKIDGEEAKRTQYNEAVHIVDVGIAVFRNSNKKAKAQ